MRLPLRAPHAPRPGGVERFARGRARAEPRSGEAGFTLIEVLVTVAISSAIVIPILTWIVIGFRVENNAVQGAKVAVSSSLLNSYFSSDVANSDAGTNVVGNIVDCGAGDVSGDPILSLTQEDPVDASSAVRTVYVVWSEDVASGEPYGLWRRQCDDATATIISEIRVIEELATVPGTPPDWSALVSCFDGPPAASPCAEVTLSADTLAPNSTTLTAKGARRAGDIQ